MRQGIAVDQTLRHPGHDFLSHQRQLANIPEYSKYLAKRLFYWEKS